MKAASSRQGLCNSLGAIPKLDAAHVFLGLVWAYSMSITRRLARKVVPHWLPGPCLHICQIGLASALTSEHCFAFCQDESSIWTNSARSSLHIQATV